MRPAATPKLIATTGGSLLEVDGLYGRPGYANCIDYETLSLR
jgi:hypothetical protein